MSRYLDRIVATCEDWSHKGIRVLAVATRAIHEQQSF